MSADRLAALADHLRESGAVFYGAYWCPHCQAQKQMFGAAARSSRTSSVTRAAPTPSPVACQAAGVRALSDLGHRRAEDRRGGPAHRSGAALGLRWLISAGALADQGSCVSPKAGRRPG